MSHTIGLADARKIAKGLRERKVSMNVADVRDAPMGDIRDIRLWVYLFDCGYVESGEAAELPEFLATRRHLRRCRRCGCTEDNACVDPGMDFACSWVGPDLCSGCM